MLKTLGRKSCRSTSPNSGRCLLRRIILQVNGQELRSIPALGCLALSVRAHVPIFVAEGVMQEAASVPEEEIEAEEGEERLEVFKDFVESLDMDDLEPGGAEPED
jgi:hypothetical protein